MAKIFISYRRSSYDAIVGRIRDKLVSHYGDAAVYMDVDNIPFGTDFREHIDKALSEGDVVVAVIGPKWLGPMRGRKPRIFDQTDPVRVEIETSLRRGITVLPILVDGANMPKPEDLPESISKLAFHNAATVDAGRDFHQHMERVIRSMDLLLRPASRKPSARRFLRFGGSHRLKWTAGAIAAAVALVSVLPIERIYRQYTSPSQATRAIELPPFVQLPTTQGSQATLPQPSMPVPAVLGQRVVLVMGNGTYKNVPSLKNTVNDALLLSEVFRSLGFSVITRTDMERGEFANALRAFQDQASKSDVAAIYYAGHAVEVSGRNYLIPVDAKIATDADFEGQAFPLDALVSAVEGAKRLRLTILDACRDNPFAAISRSQGGTRSMAGSFSPTRSISRGLARIEVAKANTLVVYAASAGQTAADGEGNHGPFAAALARHLVTPNLDIRIALGLVRDDVLRATAGQQEPYFYGSLGGEIFSLAGGK